MQLPSVAIIGRANVGKSSLFNAICRERVAIVDPTPGVTRDRISREVTLEGRPVELVDTGGVGMESAREIVEDVELQIEIAITKADLVLFVVDAQVGPHPMETDIARRLRTAQKRTIVVANKTEREEDEQASTDFYALGLGEPVPVAAAHSIGIRPLMERIVEELPDSDAEIENQSGAIKVALVGRRNVGKSTLLNSLAQEHRVVVSDLPGTTRDSVDVRVEIGDRDFLFIDTAGVRKKRQIGESIDFYSQARTEASIRRADVVVLMVDALLDVGKVDKQLAGYVIEHYKPCVVAVNKYDLAAGKASPERFNEYAHDHFPNLRFAPVVCISALTGDRLPALMDMICGLHQQSGVRVPTRWLNKVLQEATDRRKPQSKGVRPGNVLFSAQVGVAPPTIALFVNDLARITPDYERYLSNRLRAEFGFSSIPIRFVVRRRSRPPGHDRASADAEPGERRRREGGDGR